MMNHTILVVATTLGLLLNNSVHIYAIRSKSTHKDGYFYMSSSNEAVSGVELTSSVVKNLFDDTEWNVAVRFVPRKNPLETFVSGGLDPSVGATEYQFEMKGCSLRGGLVDNEFLVTSDPIDHSATAAGRKWSLTKPRRMHMSERIGQTGLALSIMIVIHLQSFKTLIFG